jgi:hypothetical protein
MKILAFLLGSSLILTTAFAQNPAPADAKAADGAAAPVPKRTVLKYTPPKGATGGIRIDTDGGSRDGEKLPAMSVIAPKGPATTTSEHPSLLWFQDGPIPEKFSKTARIDVTLLDPKTPKPLLKVSSPLAGNKQGGAGIHRIMLGKQKVTLEPGVAYKWTVALVVDPLSRSQDGFTSASIQRVPMTKELESELKNAAPGDKAAVYAQNGVWYDAVEAITAEIDKAPKDAGLRKMRADLLAANGLKEAAAYDKK